MGEMVMMNVQCPGDKPSIEVVAKKLNVTVSAIDTKFGIILVDVKRHIYTVRVDKEQLPKDQQQSEGVSGPYSDPKIAPFGTPDAKDE
ncbi:hypothetical protein [Anderseniella sp. Alg231-50]|uniref:hypothetical protein n=1 Tax=Anderseniella sp. Alg231-50 TaxID=1922226 RepID=UPI000D55439E